MHPTPVYILAIESSCDDTAAAVLANDKVLSNVVANQLVHQQYGGVVPELASRAHQQNIVPVVVAALEKAGISTEGLSSKSWDVFAIPDAPQMDLVITVCDNAAGEVCPYWPGQPATAHWGYADPSEGSGTDEEKMEAFKQTLHLIKKRLEIFSSLPLRSLGKKTLENTARELANK
jgi:protein-tyrosine-phosphatase